LLLNYCLKLVNFAHHCILSNVCSSSAWYQSAAVLDEGGEVGGNLTPTVVMKVKTLT